MEKNLSAIQEILQKLIGLHRQLMDVVRLEKEAITNADVAGVQEAMVAKEALIEAIKAQESLRMQQVAELALGIKKPARELTLPNLAILVQAEDPKRAEQLRSAYNALKILVDRVAEQNRYNLDLIQQSLTHIQQMKTNVLGESMPRSQTYGQQGQKINNASGARLFSKEA